MAQQLPVANKSWPHGNRYCGRRKKIR